MFFIYATLFAAISFKNKHFTLRYYYHHPEPSRRRTDRQTDPCA